MRTPRFVLALAVGIVACRAPQAVVPSPAPAPRAAIVEIVAQEPPPPGLPATVGALERPAALESLFTALERLEGGQATADVRILELGDSHVAADWETGPVRRQLQARFGDGGRGFVPLGRPWKAWSQEGLLTGTAGEWSTKMSSPLLRTWAADGPFGLTGFALESRQPGARSWIDLLAPSSSAEVAFLEQPGGGSFDLVVDGARAARISTRGETRRPAFHELALADEPVKHHIEVRPVGDGVVRLYGIALDRAAHGLVLDALGINGAKVAIPLSWDEASWAEDARHRAPALVIVAYGTNDAVDYQTSLETFEAGMAEALARIARSVPSASCLVLGPPDRGTAPRLPSIVASERRAAEAGHCAYFDRIAAMGGPGGIVRWGQPDHVHLRRDGYARTATAFVTDLLAAYDRWRALRGHAATTSAR